MNPLHKALNLLISGAALGGAFFLFFLSGPFRQVRAETILIVGLDESGELPDSILLAALPPVAERPGSSRSPATP